MRHIHFEVLFLKERLKTNRLDQIEKWALRFFCGNLSVYRLVHCHRATAWSPLFKRYDGGFLFGVNSLTIEGFFE